MTPIAHTLAGISGWLAVSRRLRSGEIVAFVLAANLPDVDFLLRLVPAVHSRIPHQYATHNLVFVLLSTLLLSRLVSTVRVRWALLVVAMSHPVLDLLVTDTVAPIGFPLLYPFSGRLFHVGGFPPFQRGNLAAVFTWGNLAVVLLEFLVFIVPVWILARKRLGTPGAEKDFRRLI